jgi:hypothetical protein
MPTTIELDTKAFEVFPDGIAIFEGDTCIYVNTVHRMLWIGSDSLIMPGGQYRAINPHIDQLVISRTAGQDTIQVNKGSLFYYYYLYCIPMNGRFYLLLTRDITEIYIKNERDREYKALFNVIFNAIRYPMAIVSSTGIVNRFTPWFHQCFSEEVTLVSGSFIWDYFGVERPAIKELFEELISRRQTNQQNSFTHSGFNFMMVDQFVVVYSSEIVCVETSTTDEDQVSDLLAFFRVVRAMKNLPWKTIGIGIGIILLTLQQVDPGLILRVLDLNLHPVEQAE